MWFIRNDFSGTAVEERDIGRFGGFADHFVLDD
jgi:hypothetical protein